MIDVQIDHVPSITITREDVDEADMDQLCYWFAALDEKAMQMKAFAESFRTFDASDNEWAQKNAGALAYVSIGRKWVEHRILALGGTPPYPPTDQRNFQIRQLEKEVKRLRELVPADVQQAA